MKKVTTTIFVILMFVLMFPAGLLASSFSDMPQNWSKAALEAAIENTLLKGVNGKIKPDDKLSRAQMAVVTVRALGAAAKGDLKKFSDVPKNAWYADDLSRAYKMGLVDGLSTGKLEPDAAITREQVFVILARALKLTKANTLNAKFKDADQISNWARGEVYAIVNAGYIEGDNGILNPGGFITRAEFAQIMYKTFNQYINKAGEYTSVKDGNVIVSVPGVKLKNLTVNGDLIIGDGVGDGDVTLDGVKVKGRLLVRGGGEHSVKIVGNSDVLSIIIARVGGVVRVFSEAGVKVDELTVDGSDDVILEGFKGKVNIIAKGITVSTKNSNIETVIMNGTKSEIVVDKDSNIGNIIVNGNGVTIEGDGVVGTVAANANNVAVNTQGTKVTAGTGNTGITAGGSAIAPGGSLNVPGAGSPAGTVVNGGNSSSNPGAGNDNENDNDNDNDNDDSNIPSNPGDEEGNDDPELINLTAVNIAGDAIFGSKLVAATTPAGATVSYQWKRSDSANGIYSNITAATSSTYELTSADIGKYIKVAVTGTGDYTGTVTSAAKGPVAPIVSTTGAAAVFFEKEPADLALIVKHGVELVKAEEDGSYILEAGNYTYTAMREGYVSLTDIAFTVTSKDVAAGTKSVSIKMTAKEVSAAEAAAGIKNIAAPLKDATSLKLPTVANGLTVAIKSSSKPGVIATNGTITPPDTDEMVVLVLTVIRTSDGSAADTTAITVIVPAKTAVLTGKKLALNITPVESVAGVELLADDVKVSFSNINNIILPDSATSYKLRLTPDAGKTLYHDSYTGLGGYSIWYAEVSGRTFDEFYFAKNDIQDNPSINLSYANTPDTSMSAVTFVHGQTGSRSVTITIEANDAQGDPINGIKAGDVSLTLVGDDSSDVTLYLGNYENSTNNWYGVEVSNFDQNYSDNKLSFTLTFTTEHMSDPADSKFKELADGDIVQFSASILRQVKEGLSVTLPGSN